MPAMEKINMNDKIFYFAIGFFTAIIAISTFMLIKDEIKNYIDLQLIPIEFPKK